MSMLIIGLSIGLFVGFFGAIAATLVDGYIAAKTLHRVAPKTFAGPPYEWRVK